MKSVMKHDFSRVPKADIQRSSFDRSHGYKTTLDKAGILYPIFLDEALPGDTFNLRLNAFARLATPLKPFMDNVVLDTFFFAVPYRLVWENWQKFCGEQESPGDSTDFVIPTVAMNVGGFVAGDLADYFGLPLGIQNISVSALPFRAYDLIWNEFFRDENLQDPETRNMGDGPDIQRNQLAVRGKRHDYFTSCLPFPQKGPDILLPLGNTAPVVSNGLDFQVKGSTVTERNLAFGDSSTGGSHVMYTSPTATGDELMKFGSETGLVVSLATATSATINALREAFQLQRLYERDARGGTRYTEILKSHFLVTSPDARLQRPEYLGGSTSPINVHPVAQSSPTGTYADTPQGNLAAFATGSVSGAGFSHSFTEHCLIIGLASVRADLTYQQGINRMWSRRTRFDHYWPALAHLGEQAVLNKEIFAQGTADDELVFGYQERFAEYRYKPSLITGKFRSSNPQSLDVWHLSQDFAELPVLGNEFIQENPPIDRVIAVPSEPHFLFDCFFNLTCARPMPTYGVPGMIDHF